jgi:hypothetical protein
MFSSDARRYSIKAETRFSIRSVFQAYAFVKSLHGSGLPGLIPSWISLEREKDNFILSFH